MNVSIFPKHLRESFKHLLLDEKSKEPCTLSTHLVLFLPQRLPYGVASSPALWQNAMDKILNSLEGVILFYWWYFNSR